MSVWKVCSKLEHRSGKGVMHMESDDLSKRNGTTEIHLCNQWFCMYSSFKI